MFVSSQNQGILDAIKRERGRHSAIRSVVGHMNTVSHLGRNYFKVAMATMPMPWLRPSPCDFRLILNWRRGLLPLIWTELFADLRGLEHATGDAAYVENCVFGCSQNVQSKQRYEQMPGHIMQLFHEFVESPACCWSAPD